MKWREDIQDSEFEDFSGAFIATQDLNGEDLVIGLEAVLTHTAFGHEYALMELKEELSYSQREELLSRMGEMKKQYFAARTQLSELNPERLLELEAELGRQKKTILNDKIVLH